MGTQTGDTMTDDHDEKTKLQIDHEITYFERMKRAEKRLKRLQRQQSRREKARERILALPESHPERLAYQGSNLQDAKSRRGRLHERIATQRDGFLSRTHLVGGGRE